MPDSRYCYRKNERILCRELEGAHSLIDPYRRVIVTLNPAALEIWHFIDGGHSVDEITEALRSVFEIGEDEAKADVVRFLKELVKREMVR